MGICFTYCSSLSVIAATQHTIIDPDAFEDYDIINKVTVQKTKGKQCPRTKALFVEENEYNMYVAVVIII